MAILGSTNLTGCNSIPDFIAGGSLVTFQQTAAPTSWTKQTTHNNKALRVVTGTATPGGSTAFSSVFASRTPSGTVSVSGSVSVSGGSVGNHTLGNGQIPNHSHPVGNQGGATVSALFPGGAAAGVAAGGGGSTGGVNEGSGGAHSHPFSVGSASFSGSGSFAGNALDFAVQYVDIIICSKN